MSSAAVSSPSPRTIPLPGPTGREPSPTTTALPTPMPLLRKLLNLFRRRQLEHDMAEEIRLHREHRIEQGITSGLSRAEAERQAALQFGPTDAITEAARDERSFTWLSNLPQDLRFALRRLRRTPTFTVTALLTIALCIGANLAIFAVVDAIVLRPLPFPESDRLVTIFNSYPGAGNPRAGSTIPNYFARREALDTLEGVALFDNVGTVVGEPGSLRKIQGARVTPEFFDLLGVDLARGQVWGDDKFTYQTEGVVIISHELWQSEYAGAPDILGKVFMADGLPNTIVGVLPPGFQFLSYPTQYFAPLAFNPPERELSNRHNGLPGMIMIGRLAPGATLADAQAQLNGLNARQAEVDPNRGRLAEWDFHSIIRPLHDDIVREIRPTLFMLQGGVLVLLLIGAVNLTNLLLVRSSARTREVAVRQALGARLGHLARDVWLEITLLALGGGALGLALAAIGLRLLSTLGTNTLPLGTNIAFDSRIALIGLGSSLVLGGLLAVTPIWFLRGLSINARLQSETTHGTAAGAAQRLRHIFGMAQIALAFVLLSGAALIGVSLQRVQAQATGFNPHNILVCDIGLPWKNYRGDGNKVAFVWRMEQAMRIQPGVVAVSVNNGLPFGGWVGGGPVSVEDAVRHGTDKARTHHTTGVTPHYWQAMGIPVLSGRTASHEVLRPGATQVCMIDQAMADLYWPDGDPLGRRLSLGPTFDPAKALTIIGVVCTVKQKKLAETAPLGTVYRPFAQMPSGWFRIVVRTAVPPETMANTLRETVAQMDPGLLVYNFTTMERLIDKSLQPRRSPTILTSIFAGVALLLATVGTYGVLAYTVSQRRREIGVRMALGALPRQILQRFLGSGGRLLLGGSILGLLGAWAVGRALRGFLFNVAPFPPLLIGAVAMLMSAIVLLAILIPASRAAAVNPAETLRHE